MIELGQLNDVSEVNGMKIELLPKEIIEFNVEIACNHPELQKTLGPLLKENNYAPDIYYGAIAAYCGIVLEGSYDQKYLVEQLSKALLAKRSKVVVLSGGANIVQVPKALLQ